MMGEKRGHYNLDGSFVQIDTRSLDEARQEGLISAAASFDFYLQQPVPYASKMLQIRDEDQANIDAMSLAAMMALSGALTWDATFAWRMADNTFLPLPTPQDMIALAKAAKDAVYALRKRSWAAKDAINAAVSNDDVDAVKF